jgi:hypothetical protein
MTEENGLSVSQCNSHFIGINTPSLLAGSEGDDGDDIHLVFYIVGDHQYRTMACLLSADRGIEICPVDIKMHPTHHLRT